MTDKEMILPFRGEQPLRYAERLGTCYAKTVDGIVKKIRGQFFTPREIAGYMASFVEPLDQETIHILDPGCGLGILSVALIQQIAEWKSKPEIIHLDLFETDKAVLAMTVSVMEYLQQWLSSRGIELHYALYDTDFILANKDQLQPNDLFGNDIYKQYDIVISNPPYFKIGKNDPRATIAEQIVYGQPNIYAIFMAMAAKLLRQEGQFLFIVPRGFAAGQYFRKFRQFLLEHISIRKIHLFDSRTASFKKDKVLQELLILHAKKIHSRKGIVVSTSNGLQDLEHSVNAIHPYKHIVDLSHPERIIFLPTDATDIETLSIFRKWTGSLEKYGIQISTGPVVSFRSRELLFTEWQNHSVHLVPLFQLVNTAKMHFQWPVWKKEKPQYINKDGNGKKLLLPNKNYVFLRRFSAKGDASRLVASPYFALEKEEWIGVENHLNYIYRPGGELNREEVLGLAAFLNSEIFDGYFRTFNGNINVSATELRNMPLPPLADITELGRILERKGWIENLTEINRIINDKYTLRTELQYEQD